LTRPGKGPDSGFAMNRINEATDKAASLLKETANRLNFLPAFAKKSSFQKWFLLITFSLLLSLILSPQIRISLPEYKVGIIAGKDVRADRDFLALDRNATEIKKLEAIENFRSVYLYDKTIPSQLQTLLSSTFLNFEEMHNKLVQKGDSETMADIRKPMEEGKKEAERLLNISMNQDEYNLIYKYRLSQDFLSKLSYLITVIYNDNMITNSVFTKHERDKGIIIRDVVSNKQDEKSDISSIMNFNEIDAIIAKHTKTIFSSEGNHFRQVLISFTKKLIKPNLLFSKVATDHFKEEILQSVNPIFFQVQKNEIIVREGEKISITDLDKLTALYSRSKSTYLSQMLIFLGMFLMILTLTSSLFYLSREWIKQHDNVIIDMLFLAFAVLLQIIIVGSGIFICAAVHRAFPSSPVETYFYAIPFAVSSILVAILLNRNVSFFFSILISFFISFLFANKLEMSLFSFFGNIAVAAHIMQYRKRSAFFRAGFFIGIVNAFIILVLSLLSGNLFDLEILLKMIMGFFGGVITGFLAAGITPLLEAFFDYTTDIKLLELANLNQPIFQRMIIEAPGTYHHSIVVASLVEAAAESIGANSLLAKVSAYYHDIGKIKKATYFIENQRSGENKHDKLTPKMSSLVIISHVKDGCEIAQGVKLGNKIADIIKQHHGTGLVSFFYDKAKKDKDISIRSLPESDFRYPGPKPQTREAGLVLLGDIIEASSRTLSNPTPSRINNLVKERIERVFADGQLNECEITLKDLNKIIESFARILNGIFHHRIDYPESGRKESNGINNGNSDRKSTDKSKDRS
jgi:cyclic-di-AMP phosphodiesterase PgpH